MWHCLNFIYTGEYDTSDAGSSELLTLSGTAARESATGPSSRTCPALAHIFVFAIAQNYELPKLKTLALEKFSTSAPAITAEDFSAVAKAAYTGTFAGENGICDEVVATALGRVEELMGTDAFVYELAMHADLRGFVIELLGALCNRATASAAVHESNTAELRAETQRLKELVDGSSIEASMQATVLRHCQSALNVALARVEVLETEVGAKNDEVRRTTEAGEQAEERRVQGINSLNQCQVERQRAEAGLARAEAAATRATTANTTAQAELVRLRQTSAQAVRESTEARANATHWQAASADRMRDLEAVKNLVVDTYACRNCDVDSDSDWWIEQVGQTFIFRCGNCRCRHYG